MNKSYFTAFAANFDALDEDVQGKLYNEAVEVLCRGEKLDEEEMDAITSIMRMYEQNLGRDY